MPPVKKKLELFCKIFSRREKVIKHFGYFSKSNIVRISNMIDFNYYLTIISNIHIQLTGLQYKQFLNDLNKTSNLYDAKIIIDDWARYALILGV